MSENIALNYASARMPYARPVGIQHGEPGYTAPELRRPSHRPGSSQAYAQPSRINDRLHWPDGQVTDLRGQPLVLR
jgi:hypothetical protein